MQSITRQPDNCLGTKPAIESSLRWSTSDWLLLALVVAVAAAVFLPFLGSITIIDSSEGYYSEAAREMLASGDYITPYLNYRPWFEKPILTFWLIAASYQLFGVNEYAARFPAAASGILLAAFVFVFGRRFLSRRAALLSALVLLSTPLFVVVGHLSLTDMPFTLCVSVALGSLLCLLEGAPAVYIVIGYVALGLAILAKGPLAPVLTAVVVLPYLFWTSRTRQAWRARMTRLCPLLGTAIVALVAAPWYLAVSFVTRGEFASDFFINQNLGRAAGKTVHRHTGLWYYLPFFFGGCAPWSILLLPGVGSLAGELRQREQASMRARICQYGTIWLVAMLSFFSLVPTKLGTYILPAIPALAIIVGAQLDVLMSMKQVRRLAFTGVTFVTAAAVSLVLLPRALHLFPGSHLAIVAVLVSLLAGFVLYTGALWLNKARLAFSVLISISIVGCCLLVPYGLSAYHRSHQLGFHRLVLKVQEAGANAAFCGPSVFSAAFYLRRRVPALETEHDFQAFLKDGSASHWLLIHRDRLQRLAWAEQPARLIEQQGKWYLYAIGEKGTVARQ